MHAYLCSSVSCFGTHPAQILIPKVLLDDGICSPQLTSNLLVVALLSCYISSGSGSIGDLAT